MLRFGPNKVRDPTQAYYWYRVAADLGSPGAQCAVGWCYKYPRDEKAWNVDKLETLSDMTIMCEMIVGDEAKHAMTWFQKAAEQNYAPAQCMLGLFFECCEEVKDDDLARKWYEKAAEQGSATAQFRLSWYLIYGRGIQKDLAKGVQWLEKAANQGNALRNVIWGNTILPRMKIKLNAGIKKLQIKETWQQSIE